MANTYGDRHPAVIYLGRHHAKLMANATFSYCEVLVDVHGKKRFRQSGKHSPLPVRRGRAIRCGRYESRLTPADPVDDGISDYWVKTYI